MEYCKKCGHPCKRCEETLIPLTDAHYTLYKKGQLTDAAFFKESPLPTFNNLFESDSLITGNGIPGAAVEVTLPDGTKSAATVNGNGLWLIILSPALHLTAGQTVSATQTITGQSPSAEAVTAVIRTN